MNPVLALAPGYPSEEGVPYDNSFKFFFYSNEMPGMNRRMRN